MELKIIQNVDRSSRKKVSRTHLLIFPKFQLMLLAANLAVIVGAASLIWVRMQNAFSNLAPLAGLSGYEVEYYKNYLAYQSSAFQTSLLWALAFGVVGCTLATLMISHRFAGPLIRLRNFFRALGQDTGPTPELNFRDGDYLSDLPPLINKALSVVEEKSARRKSA